MIAHFFITIYIHTDTHSTWKKIKKIQRKQSLNIVRKLEAGLKYVVSLFCCVQIGDETGQMTAQMNLSDLKSVLGIHNMYVVIVTFYLKLLQ